MSATSQKILTPSQAWSYALINLCATPGLGTVMARRFVSGIAQLMLAIAGFGLIVAWMGVFFWRLSLQGMDRPVPHQSYHGLGKLGALCFVTAWIWSAFSSISLI